MEIESTRGSRIYWTIVGLGLAGAFVAFLIAVTVQSGPDPIFIVPVLFPIGLGIAAFVWLGLPTRIRVDTSEVSYVPPIGQAKVFPRALIKGIVRVRGGRGTSSIEFRDESDGRLLRIPQGFAMADMENLAQNLGARFSWDMDWSNAVPAAASPEQARESLMAMLTPEQRAEALKHMKTPDGGSQP